MSDKYNDGVLDEKFEGIHEKIETYAEAQLETLGRIEIQTKKTNGSVADIQRWREQMVGGMKYGTPLLMVIVGFMGWLAIDYLNHRDHQLSSSQIQAAMYNAIQEYNTKVINRP